jgi:mannosyltransferase OCH1-like enzyme
MNILVTIIVCIYIYFNKQENQSTNILLLCILLVYNMTNNGDCVGKIGSLEEFKSNNGFPLNIFQTNKTQIQNNIPYNNRKWSNTWIKYNPEFNYILLDDFDNRHFINTYFPWFLKKYDSYDIRERLDVIRYFLLYQYGGIYADIDSECLKNFKPLLEKHKNSDIIIGKDGKSNILISKPKQLFWLIVFKLLFKPGKGYTGPPLLHEAIEMYNKYVLPDPEGSGDVKILDPSMFFPIEEYNPIHRKHNRKQSRLPLLGTNLTILDSEMFYPQYLEHVQLLPKNTHTQFPNSYSVTFWNHNYY